MTDTPSTLDNADADFALVYQPVASNDDDMSAAPLHFNFAEDVFDRWAHERPDAPALWLADAHGAEDQKFTFRRLQELSLRAACLMRQHGLKRGDQVLLMLHRVPEWWISMLGLIRLGAVPMPCTTLLTPHDLTYRVETARVAAVVTDAEGAGKLSGFGGVRWQIGEPQPGWISFDEELRQAPASFNSERTRADDPGILYFTSATTGAPKMVVHTQASYGLAHRLTGELWLDLRPTDVHWNISDLGWAKAAWSSFYGPWHQGACVFALDARGRFHPSLALETLARYPITTCCMPPTALRMLEREDVSRHRFPHLRHCVTAGEPLNPEVLERWKSATGLTLHEAYGQTETVVLIGNFRSQGHTVKPGSMGRVAPGFDVALLDEDLQRVPDGHEGEIAIRVAPNRPLGLFKEYWLNPAEMARQFRGDWYLTGDRATRDGDGYFWFIGRKDDVIKSSGYRIGPFEVESALMTHPAVLEAGVVGKPDLMRGQIVKAFVVLRRGVTASEALKSQLQQHCKQVAAPYKYPREIEFVPELPKTISGKTRRIELRHRDSALSRDRHVTPS